jgi:diacylglycerol kinase family enzyme
MAERDPAEPWGETIGGSLVADAGPDWVGFAVNAASGRGGGRAAVVRLVRELERLGLESRIAWTLDERKALVDAASTPSTEGRCRCLVAVGGDGTVAALINERPGVPIAVMPAGTENLFARHFGFGRNPVSAAVRLVEGRSSPLDLGLIGGRRFALMAGFGFDADVVSRHHAARIGQSGQLRTTHRAAYVEPVLRSSFGYRFPELRLKTEGVGGREETLTGTTAFVFNLPRYALGLPFAPAALGDDGWLALSMAGRTQASPGPTRDPPSEGPPGRDRDFGVGADPARWRPRRRDRGRRAALDHRGPARSRECGHADPKNQPIAGRLAVRRSAKSDHWLAPGNSLSA